VGREGGGVEWVSLGGPLGYGAFWENLVIPLSDMEWRSPTVPQGKTGVSGHFGISGTEFGRMSEAS